MSLIFDFLFSDFLPLPKLTDDNSRVFLYRFETNDAEKYDFINGLKVFFLFSDVRMVVEDQLSDGDVPIFDMNHFTLKHLTKIVLPVLKKYMVYTQVSFMSVYNNYPIFVAHLISILIQRNQY